MSEQSRLAFEAWYDNDISEPLPDDYTILGKRYLYMGWQAATAEANKRIEALESEVAELKELLSDRTQDLEFEYNRAEENFLSCGILQSEIDKLNEINEGINCPVCGSLAVSPKEIWYTKQIAALQASNNHLREALEEMVDAFKHMQTAFNDCVFDKARKALSTTPAESLAKHDDMKGK